jgi:parvulin-like peptidyl-prolyl isomerase
MRHEVRRIALILIAVVVAVTGRSRGSETTCPLLSRDYQPRLGTVLMTSAGQNIDAEDLFLFMVAKEKDPLLLSRYEEAKDSKTKQELRKEVEQYLEEMAFMRSIAAKAGAGAEWDTFDDVWLRVALHPIYELVWVDKYVRGNVKIAPEDVQKYYNEHKADYAVPEKVIADYVFLRSPDSLTEVERNKVKERLEQVRSEVVKGKNFDEARKISEVAPGAKERGVLEIAQGEEPQVLFTVASALKIGGISEVIDAKDGFYLLRVKEKREKSYRPIETVKEDIGNKILFCKFLRFQYNYELEKLQKEYRPKMDLGNFEYYDDDYVVVQVGDFEVTKRVFWKLYPGIIKPDFAFDVETLFRRGQRMVDLELIAQDCERRGLSGDERIARGKTICRDMIAAAKAMQRRVAPHLRVTEEEQQNYFKQHPEVFKQEAAKKVYQVWGSIRSQAKYSEGELDFMKKELGGRLGEMMKEGKKKVEDEISSSVGKVHKAESGSLMERTGQRSAFIDYSKIFKRLTERYTTREFTFAYKSLGYIRMQDYPAMRQALEKVPLGGFSKIGYYQNSAVVFFLADEKAAKDLKYDDIKNVVEMKMAESIREKVAREMRDEFLRKAHPRSMLQ